MHPLYTRLALVIIGVFLIVSAGCARTQATSFYLLAPLPHSETGTTAAEGGLVISIGPVALPGYLDRPQIVSRPSENTLHLAVFNQWGEPLQINFAHVLAENVSILLPTDHIAVFPDVIGTPHDLSIAVQVTRFERDASGNAVLTARWQILEGRDSDVLLTRNSSFSLPIDGQDYEATVTALNQTLTDFSREVAGAINSLSETASP